MTSDVKIQPAENIASIEQYFFEWSEKVTNIERDARALLRAISRVQKGLRSGDVASSAKSIADARETADRVARSMSLLSSFRIDLVEDTFREAAYFQEIADLATARGISGVRSTEGKLFSYPYVVERKKAGLALSIGSKITKHIRPTAVVDALAAARNGRSRFEHRALLDAIERIYDLTLRGQATDLVDIEDIYDSLTVMPGSDKDYPFLEFLATLDEIKRSGLVTSKSRRALDLPPPSTTGKGGRALTLIREDGRERLYRMLRLVAKLPSMADAT